MTSTLHQAKVAISDEDKETFLAIRQTCVQDGKSMSYEDVLAIWRLLIAIPGYVQTTVWLETGNQKIGGYLHVLWRHELDFLKFHINSPFRALDTSSASKKVPYDFDCQDKPGTISFILNNAGEAVFVATGLKTSGYIITCYPMWAGRFMEYLSNRNLTVPRLPAKVHKEYADIFATSDQESEGSLTFSASSGDLPHQPQDPSTRQFYIYSEYSGPIYFSDIGKDYCEILDHGCLGSNGWISQELSSYFEYFDDNFLAAGDRDEEDLNRWSMTLAPLILAYKLRRELDERQVAGKVWGEFDPSLEDEINYVEATGRNLRLARDIVLSRVLTSLSTISSSLPGPSIENGFDLSSSHAGDAS